MSTGTGNLPYPGKVYSPFDVLTAEELNEDVANIESLADGSGLGDGAVGADNLALSARSAKIGIIPGSVFSATGSRTFDTGTGWKPRLLRFTPILANDATNFLSFQGACDADLNQFVWAIAGTAATASRAGNTSGTCIRIINTGATTNIVAAGVTNISDLGVLTFNVVGSSAAVSVAYEAIF